MLHDFLVQMAKGKTMSNVGCFVGVAETIVGSLCVFSFFCFTSLGDCTRPQHQETTGTLLSLLFMTL